MGCVTGSGPVSFPGPYYWFLSLIWETFKHMNLVDIVKALPTRLFPLVTFGNVSCFVIASNSWEQIFLQSFAPQIDDRCEPVLNSYLHLFAFSWNTAKFRWTFKSNFNLQHSRSWTPVFHSLSRTDFRLVIPNNSNEIHFIELLLMKGPDTNNTLLHRG